MITCMIRYRNNTNLFVIRGITAFVDITILNFDPTDTGAGNQIRFWFRVYLDEWLWEYGNVELWYLGLLPAPY